MCQVFGGGICTSTIIFCAWQDASEIGDAGDVVGQLYGPALLKATLITSALVPVLRSLTVCEMVEPKLSINVSVSGVNENGSSPHHLY